MKALSIGSEEEFIRLLEDISAEASHAVDPWELLKNLDAAGDQYALEIHQTPAFWHVTFTALHEAVLSYLGRLYDKTPGSLSIGCFLSTVKNYPQFFTEQAFRRRLQGNPHVDTLVERAQIDSVTLESEIKSVSDQDALVRKLHNVRNKRVAHRDGNMVRLATMSSITGLTAGEIDTLIERGNGLVSKYGLMFRASFIASRIFGHEDYADLLRLVKQSIDFNTAQVEDEIRRDLAGAEERRMAMAVGEYQAKIAL
jgi:hypothetical protein